MKKADLKTDGTVYKAVPTAPISQNYGVMDHQIADVVLLDLNDPEQPGSRYREERRPIRTKLVKSFGNKKRGEIIHLSARRVLMTAEQHVEKEHAQAEQGERWEREVAENRAINEPLAAELNRLQKALGLTTSSDCRPIVSFHVNQYGRLETSSARIGEPVELRETLARLEAAATAMGVIGTTEEA